MSNQKPYYQLSTQESLRQLSTSPEGLSIGEVKERLIRYGRNELQPAKESLWRKIVEPFANYFVMVILLAAVISIAERKWLEAFVISGIIIINAMIYYVQRASVSRVVKSLQKQDQQKISVLRSHQSITVLGSELVPGDIIRLHEGVVIPADGRIIEALQLEVNEAALTGESLPVHKVTDELSGSKQIYEQSNMGFKGTFVSRGTGLMLVTATGESTQLGAINTLTRQADLGKTPTEKKIDILTKKIIVIIGVISTTVFALAIARGITLEEALRFSLSLTVSAVPEGLPIALTLVLLFSARKMATQKALVKKISAMETLGAVTLIATDKTGTLTKNKLAVVDTYTNEGNLEQLSYATAASLNQDKGGANDPLDILLSTWTGAQQIQGERYVDLPFDQELRMSGVLYKHKGKYVLYVKGAPEAILAACKHSKATDRALAAFVSNGYRTIGIAHGAVAKPIEALHTKHLTHFTLDGLIALADELRPNIKQSIDQAHAAGINVVMLTGDHVATARHIAQQVHIAKTPEQIADSTLLESSSLNTIRQALSTIKAFGRVLPKHKYQLLKATRGHEVTAMTGDGVNDIPALVEANVGLAMGTGTDAAKNASDVVLLNNNFATIIAAIRSGRTVLANIKKMLVYLLATTGGEVLTMIGALLLGLPLPITAVMVLWINLATDGFVVIPLGLSPAETHQMNNPPEKPDAPLLNKVLGTRAIFLAAVMAITVLSIFSLNLPKGQAYAQTAAFMSLIVIQWANAININYEYSSWISVFRKPNFALLGAIAISLIMNLALFVTPLGNAFGIIDIQSTDILIATIVPIIVILLACDVHKRLSRFIPQK
jgi:Ca2+-transporting ATPase